MEKNTFLGYVQEIKRLFAIKYETHENNWTVYLKKSTVFDVNPGTDFDFKYAAVVESRFLTQDYTEETGYYDSEETALMALTLNITERIDKEIEQLKSRLARLEGITLTESEPAKKEKSTLPRKTNGSKKKNT